MKHLYSKAKDAHGFNLNGEFIAIEFRPKLKMFDLVYYPDIGKMIGPGQYIRKFKARSNDFLFLVGVIVKLSYYRPRPDYMQSLKLLATIEQEPANIAEQ